MEHRDDTVERKIARMASSTHGVVTRAALLDSGITPADERCARSHAYEHYRDGYPQARATLGWHRCSGYQTAALSCWLARFRD